jgi:hypothetical protein
VALVGDEALGVLASQDSRVVSAAGCVQAQEHAEFERGPAQVVQDTGGAQAAWPPQQLGDVVPDQVTQPTLRDTGQVDMAVAVREANTEVLSLQEPALLGLIRGEVDQPKVVQDLLGDAASELGAAVQVQVDQGVHVARPAGGHQFLDPAQVPARRPRPLGVHEQPPLQLGPHQRTQSAQVELAGPGHRGLGRAPGSELSTVAEGQRDGLSGVLETLPPTVGQLSPARAVLPAVASLVSGTQSERGVSQRGADHHLAGPVAGVGLLVTRPPREVGGLAALLAVQMPAPAVPLTQSQVLAVGGTLRADPADLVHPRGERAHRLGGGDERGLADPALHGPDPFFLVDGAQVAAAPASLAAADRALPPVDAVPARDPHDVGAKQRVERRAADQRGQDLQAVALLTLGTLGVERAKVVGALHWTSPQTARSAASNAGSWTSTCP